MSGAGPTSGKTIFSLTNHELYVVSAIHEGKANGQIATWIMPTTLVPGVIRVVASISPMNYTHEFIRQSGRFAISMLAEDQVDLTPHFGLESGRRFDKFASLEVEYTPSGIPVPAGTCGWIECKVIDSIDTGDRIVYVADGTASALSPDRQPLRKQEAFAALPEEVRRQLAEKQARDGERDASSIRNT